MKEKCYLYLYTPLHSVDSKHYQNFKGEKSTTRKDCMHVFNWESVWAKPVWPMFFSKYRSHQYQFVVANLCLKKPTSTTGAVSQTRENVVYSHLMICHERFKKKNMIHHWSGGYLLHHHLDTWSRSICCPTHHGLKLTLGPNSQTPSDLWNWHWLNHSKMQETHKHHQPSTIFH